jgi:trehalose synthase-fused probable maltokinase
MPNLVLACRSIDSILQQSCRSSLESEILPAYLPAQRWFASKRAALESVRIKQCVRMEADQRSLLLIVEAGALGAMRDYQLPVTLQWDRPPNAESVVADVAFGDDRGWLVDAYSDDLFVRRLLATSQQDSAPAQRVCFCPTAHFNVSALEGAAIVRTGAEQSNTSIRIGQAILKAYRSLAEGVHPEQEIGAFLTKVQFVGAPPLLGTVELTATEGVSTILGVVQQLVVGAEDGWTYVTEHLTRLTDADSSPHADLLKFVERLGSRTAGLHLALAADVGNPDFAPVPFPEGWFKDWSHNVAASVDNVFALLGQRQESAGLSPDQVKAFIAVHSDAAPKASLIRIHGDYHLGQVLVTPEDVFIVDFEGEPMRSLAERRRKSPSLRDVAGMLRSFDYALASCSARPNGSSAETFVAELKQKFLRSYLARVSSHVGFPPDIVDANKLLMMGLLEKTLYEIKYELNNRPDWVAIPLRGLRDLVETPGALGFVP